jgi:small subunit ribosomal protein S1
LHVSQISKDHVEKPSDVLSVGQEIEAKVVEFKEDDHKISLSMKALLPDADEKNDDAEYADVNVEEVANELD